MEDVVQPEPPAEPVHLANLARRLGIPPEFLFRVVNEPDDWTFVLKVHALIETALTDTLMRRLRQPALEGKIRGLTLNTKRDWAGILNLIPAGQLNFVQGFAAMRNKIAHQIASVPTFTLVRGVQSLDQSLRQKVVGASLVNSTDPEAIRRRVTTNAIRVLLWCEAAENAREAEVLAEQARIHADVERLRRNALLTLLSDSQRNP